MSRKSGQNALNLLGFLVLIVSAIVLFLEFFLKAFGGDINTGAFGVIISLLSYFIVAWVGWAYVSKKKKGYLIAYILSIIIILVLFILPTFNIWPYN